MSEYDNIRNNFKKQTKNHFKFLVEEFGYDAPILNEHQQPNGVVISDKFEYKNHSANKTIRIENSYHPADYGFEINFWNSLNDINHADGQMLEYVLKENQDIEQLYIEKLAKIFKERYKSQII